jgi:glycosyltransferase involved in cell wall biosynthesis
LNILIVSQHFWPETFRINEVVTSLRRNGCNVTVLTGQPNYPEGKVFNGYRALSSGKEIHPEGYTIVRVPLVPRGSGSVVGMIANYLSFVVAATVMAPWLLRGQRFDAIFVYAISPILQAIPAIVIKWLKRVSLTVWVQDLWPQSLEVTGFIKNKTVLGVVRTLTRWIYRRSDLLLVQSEAFIPEVGAMAGAVPVRYHPNPGDLPHAQVLSDDAGYELRPGFNVVVAGNVGTAQSPDTLLNAARALVDQADIRIVVVGSGSRLDWLRRQAAELGLDNLEFAGRFPSTAMPAIFAQASALLVTLGKETILTQTIPSKISSYLAAGRPIIGSIDGEGAHIINAARAGITAPAEDAPALAAAILAMRDAGDAMRAQWGQSGKRYFDENFEPGKLALTLESLLREAGPNATGMGVE